MNISKITMGLGTGLLADSVVDVLPTLQFWFFVVGISLINYANCKRM
ncbi:hypothetical protein [Marinomonas sp. 2405UD68-3]